jgi:hypothetical protein
MISWLPEIFFDICLLWQPQRISGSMLRRKSRIQSPNCILPSWFWAGWITEVTWPYTWIRTLDITAPAAVMMQNVRPFIRLNCTTEKGGIEASDCELTGQLRMHRTRSGDPPQWLRHKLKDSEDYGRIEQCYFTLDSDPAVGFWFPLPICKQLELPKMIEIIEFRTTAGKFRLGDTRRSLTRSHALDGTVAGVYGNMWRRTMILCVQRVEKSKTDCL